VSAIETVVMEFVSASLIEDDLTPHPLGAKTQRWATSLPELEGSTTTLNMRRSVIDDMLYCVNDDVYDHILRDIEGYEEGKHRVRKTESRDILRKRRDREHQRKEREEKTRDAPPPPPSELTSSELFLQEQQLLQQREFERRLQQLKSDRPVCPCNQDPCQCPCDVETPCFVEPAAVRGKSSIRRAQLSKRGSVPQLWGRKQPGGADGANYYETEDGDRLGYFSLTKGTKGTYGLNQLAEEFFKDSAEYQSRFKRDDNESPDNLCPQDQKDLEDFFGYTCIYEPDLGAIRFEEWKRQYHTLITRAFGTSRVMRDEIKANFERGKGRRPWYPPLSHLHWIPAEVEESIRDRREEKEEEAKRKQLEAETKRQSEEDKTKHVAEKKENWKGEEEVKIGNQKSLEEEPQYSTIEGRRYRLDFLKDGTDDESSNLDCQRLHGKGHFTSRQPLIPMPILDKKVLCRQLWRLDLSDLGLEIISGLGFFPFLGFLNLTNNNLDWKQLRNLHSTGIIELYVGGNPPLEKEHNYRFHLLDTLPKVWMIDGHFASTTERCKVATWFAKKGLDTADPAYHKISVNGVFQTSAEKTVNKNPLKANFNSKAYDCMGALPNYRKLIRSKDIDKIKRTMFRRELQDEVSEMLTKVSDTAPRMAEIRRGIPADFLDRLEPLSGSVKLNFVVMLLVVTGLFPIPEWLVKELLAEWKIKNLAGVEMISLFRLQPKWRVRITSSFLANIHVLADFGEDYGMSPWLLKCLFCGMDWLVRQYLPRKVITTQFPEKNYDANRKKERYILTPSVTQALSTELALALMASAKTLAWILDNHEREKNIIVQQVKSHQEEITRQSLEKHAKLTMSAQNPVSRVEREVRDTMESLEELKAKQMMTFRRLCTFTTGNKLFHKALRKYAFKTKDPDKVMKCLISHIVAPKPDPIYKVFRGVTAQMMNPMTYLKILDTLLPRMDYEPRTLKSSRLLASGLSTVSSADRVDNNVIASAELRRQLEHEKWLWERQLGSKAGEEVFVDAACAGVAGAAAAGVVSNKPERHLALLTILHPPDAHFTPERAAVDYPLRQTNYTYQNVSKLQKRMLELYDVPPYENEKQYVDGGWRLKEEDLWPKPKPKKEDPKYGLPRVDIGGGLNGGVGGVGGGGGSSGRTAPTFKGNVAGAKMAGVNNFRREKNGV